MKLTLNFSSDDTALIYGTSFWTRPYYTKSNSGEHMRLGIQRISFRIKSM